MHYCWWNYYFG